MKNAQDEGLKPQPTDITASSVVINKSEENSPQIQVPLVNKESTKTQSVIEASQKQENGKPTSSTSIPEISVPVNGEVSKKVSDLSTEDNDNVKSIQAVEVRPIVS